MKDFSLQLFSLRDTATMAERFRIAAEAGYTGVEFAGYDDMSAAELKCLLREYGLRPAGSHIPIQWLLEDIGQCVRYCAELGTETATCSGWDWEDKSEQTVADQIAFLEKCAGKFEEAGIPFAYHNHYWEFEDHNGKRAIDAVLQNTEKLKLQLDVMWVEYAGVNTVDFIKAHQ